MNKTIIKAIIFIISVAGIYLLFSYFGVSEQTARDQLSTTKITESGYISRPEQLYKLVPTHLLTDYPYWAKFDPVTPSLITGFYNRYAFHMASTKPVGGLIRAAITKNIYNTIPTIVIFRYLKSGQFNVQGQVKNSTLPYLNYSLFGYQGRHLSRNNRVLHIAQILIARGADVNAVDANSGRNPLHEAILMNHHEVVRFLLRHNANPELKVNQPKSKFHGMNALNFAIFMNKVAPGERYSDIIKTLTLHQLKK